jgi:hypothetical protein
MVLAARVDVQRTLTTLSTGVTLESVYFTPFVGVEILCQVIDGECPPLNDLQE